jgi:hypothetical protein
MQKPAGRVQIFSCGSRNAYGHLSNLDEQSRCMGSVIAEEIKGVGLCEWVSWVELSLLLFMLAIAITLLGQGRTGNSELRATLGFLKSKHQKCPTIDEKVSAVDFQFDCGHHLWVPCHDHSSSGQHRSSNKALWRRVVTVLIGSTR